MQKWNPLLINISILLIWIIPFSGSTQDIRQTNLEILTNLKQKQTAPKHKHRDYTFKKETNILKKYNPVNLTFGSLLYLYQNVLSTQFSADCLYHPTCSDFSKQAIQNYGLLKGIFITADRITRCNRIAATSISPLVFDTKTNHALDKATLYQFKKDEH